MEAMRTRTLEVRVISGENLCIDRAPVTENVSVTVRAESLKCWSTKMARQEAESSSTLWNEKLMMEVPLHAQSITFEVQCKTTRGTVRSIGLARIGIWDLIPREDQECLEMQSYRLRNWEGRRSGVINFSVKEVKEEGETAGKEKDSMIGVGRHQDVNNHSNGYVMGIPVWWNHVGVHV
ncbi:BON1-associated protein 2-like [Prosopis cineraria]|uniref:BON1-associated protein 2-like n=1 Tax=Prosopis cineraria TaxID=364024 RepID=UPI00240F3725|nr:BON1-associated protein 2-like [Prosopis cineraria]